MLCAFGHHVVGVVACCDMLRHVQCCWLKFENDVSCRFTADLLVAPSETELLMLVRQILQTGIPLLVSLTVCVSLCSNNIKGP